MFSKVSHGFPAVFFSSPSNLKIFWTDFRINIKFCLYFRCYGFQTEGAAKRIKEILSNKPEYALKFQSQNFSAFYGENSFKIMCTAVFLSLFFAHLILFPIQYSSRRTNCAFVVEPFIFFLLRIEILCGFTVSFICEFGFFLCWAGLLVSKSVFALAVAMAYHTQWIMSTSRIEWMRLWIKMVQTSTWFQLSYDFSQLSFNLSHSNSTHTFQQ